jgi:DNA-binding FadR family transcriptional regulator
MPWPSDWSFLARSRLWDWSLTWRARSAQDGDYYAEATADAAFHGRIVELAGNATLERVWRTLEPFSRTYITMVVPGVDRRRIADLHSPILAALRLRDPEVAAAVLHDHFADTAAMLASLWAAPASPAVDEARPGEPPALPVRRRARREPDLAPSLAERSA